MDEQKIELYTLKAQIAELHLALRPLADVWKKDHHTMVTMAAQFGEDEIYTSGHPLAAYRKAYDLVYKPMSQGEHWISAMVTGGLRQRLFEAKCLHCPDQVEGQCQRYGVECSLRTIQKCKEL